LLRGDHPLTQPALACFQRLIQFLSFKFVGIAASVTGRGKQFTRPSLPALVINSGCRTTNRRDRPFRAPVEPNLRGDSRMKQTLAVTAFALAAVAAGAAMAQDKKKAAP
jgi:hypothetical protein